MDQYIYRFNGKPLVSHLVHHVGGLFEGMAGFWIFQEFGGSVLIDLLGRSDATINISSITRVEDSLLNGEALHSAATTSVGRGVVVEPSISIIGADFAIECMIRNDGSDTYGTLLANAAASRGFWTKNSGSGFVLDYVDAAGGDVLSTTVLSHGVDYHIVATSNVDGSKHDYYVDGLLDSSVSGTFPNVSLDTMLNDSLSDTFVGVLRYMRLWNRRLSEVEVEALYRYRYELVPSNAYSVISISSTVGGRFFFAY